MRRVGWDVRERLDGGGEQQPKAWEGVGKLFLDNALDMDDSHL